MNRKVDEVCIDDDVIRRSQLHVVLEEEPHSVLLHALDLDLVQTRDLDLLLLLVVFTLLDLLRLVLLLHQTRVLGVQHSLNLSEFASLVGFALESVFTK